MAVLNNVEFVRIYDRARFALGAEAEKRKELVVEGNGDRHISNRYLNMIDYRLHSSSSSFSAGTCAVCFHEKIITIDYFLAYTPAVTLL